MIRAAFMFALAVLGGCATSTPVLDSTNSAELGFARTAAPGGLPGRFDSIDGKRLEGSPLAIRIPAGTHVIGYSCPDVISVDLQATVESSFTAGRAYALECSANAVGVVHER